MLPKEEILKKEQEEKDRVHKYKKLVKFLQGKGLRSKEAVWFDSRISYFRGIDLLETIQQNTSTIGNAIKETYEKEINSLEEAKSFSKFLLNEKVIIQFERDDDKKYKWPKKLRLTKSTDFNEKNFYSWNMDLRGKSTFFLMILVLIFIFGICLFPVWPFEAKIAIFYVSVVLLYFMVGFIVIRLFFFIVLRIIGVDSWIFPNLFEDVAFFDSFRPVFSWKRSDDGWTELGGRIIALIVLIFLGYKLSQEPQIVRDYSDMGSQTFNDIIDWGRLKIEGKTEEKLMKKGIPNLNDIINEENESKNTEKNSNSEENENIQNNKNFEEEKNETILNENEENLINSNEIEEENREKQENFATNLEEEFEKENYIKKDEV